MNDSTATPSPITLALSDPYSPEAISMYQALWDAIEPLYGNNEPCTFVPEDLIGPGAALILAWQGGHVVGSGAVRPLFPGIAEVKRMYVAPEARRQGIARSILAELEIQARRLGYARVHLETGKLQPEAIRLYEQAGYEHVAPFGKYIDDPLSVYFGKTVVSFSLSPIEAQDRDWVRQFLLDEWGSDFMVSKGKVMRPYEHPGFFTTQNEERVGLVTYEIRDGECEVTLLQSLRPGSGVGTALLTAAVHAALHATCRRVWLITTNDNLNALGFYQKRGFTLAAVYPNAMEETRRLKPNIPLIGDNGIPLRDEIELEYLLPEKR